MPPAWKRYLPLGWSVLLCAVILAPLLAPGYVLHLDMVFVPQQTLLPWNLGIGAGLPRSVPQDAVVSLLAGPLSGQLLQKAVLVATMVLAGTGAARLTGGSTAQRVAAASLYVWSAYLAGRLLMGHWGLLWAYALLPWAVVAAGRARRSGTWPPVAALCGLGALVPSGGLLLAIAAVPLAVGFGSHVGRRARWGLVGLVTLFNAAWWLPAVRSGVADTSDPLGLVVFGARADGPGGVLVSVLAGGGVWNSQATLGSRTTWFAALSGLVLAGLAVAGWRAYAQQRRPEAHWLGLLAAAGLVWAWLSGVAADQVWMQSVVAGVPGGGLLRDGQKWTAYWVLLLAVCAPYGVTRLTRTAQHSIRLVLLAALALLPLAALALLPLAALPDLAWAGFGRLQTSQYPAAWNTVREQLAEAPATGDVLSLPWAPFRRYAWNADDVVLDPLPRYLTRTVVWNDQLPVTIEGRIVQVGGDDPRAATVSEAMVQGRALGPVLGSLGIRFVVVQTDQPQAGPAPDLGGTVVRSEVPGMQVREVSGPVRPVVARDRLVVAVDAVAAVAVLLVVGAAFVGARRRDSDVTP